LKQKNLKLIIEYDGTEFLGWQIQKAGRTVQGEIESAIKKIFNKDSITLIGSGRTDSGVHAKAQTAHVKVTTEMDCEKIRKAINGNIGNDVYISNCGFIDENFHARFQAKVREYFYLMTDSYSPLNRNKEWFLPQKLSDNLLMKCANTIIGTHDFTFFCKANSEVKNKICTIISAEWKIENGRRKFIIRANRYLQHMVRYLVGTMIEVARGRYSIEQFELMLNCKQEDIMVYRAPAHGLYLWRVEYE